jgi:hypothetical protein
VGAQTDAKPSLFACSRGIQRRDKTRRWRERDSNFWSRRLQEPFETLIGSRGIAPSDGEADSVAGGTGGLKPRSSAGGSILTGAFNEKSLRPGLGKRFVKMPRAVLIPGIISRSERRPG